MFNAVLAACWDTTAAWRVWTEQWRHDQVGRCLLYQTEPFYHFFRRKFNQRQL